MIYVVNVSGGLTSFEAWRRAIDQHGRDNVRAVFADVKGSNPSEHAGEDQDTYRFLDETEAYLQSPVTRLRHPLGWDIWDAMKASRKITIMTGRGFVAACSTKLKRDLINTWITETFTGQEITRVFGMEWVEIDRMDALRDLLAPTPVWFPLSEPPYVDKCTITAFLETLGIKPPRLYAAGFDHGNCGGFCVKAGQAHFANLWRTNLPRYLYHEAKEQAMIDYLGKKVAILRDRRGGKSVPMTLAEFRQRLERGEAYDTTEWGGCGCFAPIAQGRIDLVIAEAQPKLPTKRRKARKKVA